MFASHYLKYFCNTLIQNIIAESDDSHCYLVDSNIVRGCYLQIQPTRVYFFEKQYSDYRGVLISSKPITWFSRARYGGFFLRKTKHCNYFLSFTFPVTSKMLRLKYEVHNLQIAHSDLNQRNHP